MAQMIAMAGYSRDVHAPHLLSPQRWRMTGETIRQQLGAELRRLRTLAGIPQAGIRVGETALSQATASRFERGERLPNRAEVLLWLDATGADEETRARVVALAEAAHSPDRPLTEAATAPLTDDERARIAEHLEAALRLVRGDERDD